MAKSKTKIYFWLKFDKNFFDNLVIKNLRQIASGDTYVIIYQRMMLESLADEGVIYYEGTLESIYDEIAMKLGENLQDVKFTISYFISHNLIQIDSNQNLELLQVPAILASETNMARYQRVHREKVKSLTMSDQCQTLSNSCQTEIEIDIEKEIENKSKSNNHSKRKNILSGKPDFSFPNWLTEKSVEVVKKGKADNYLIRIPLAYLNQKTGRNFKFVDRNLKLIMTRFREGYSLEDFKQVIDIKCAEWSASAEFSKYLRPETLFGTKFESYLNQSMPRQKSSNPTFDPNADKFAGMEDWNV